MSLWAMLPDKRRFIRKWESRTAGWTAAKELAAKPIKMVNGRVVVIPMQGVITQKPSWYSGCSADSLSAYFDDAVNDTSVGAIVFDINSPGGNSYGIQELSDQIFKARGTKPIYAVANSLAASGLYWIATAADQIICTPSGDVGSIGVYAMHIDWSGMNEAVGIKPTYIFAGKYKIEGNPDEPLGDEATKHIQDSVDSTYEAFVRDVARNRGVTPKAVKGGYGEGRVLVAPDAQREGMIDRIDTMRNVLAKLGADLNKTQQRGMRVSQARAMRANRRRRVSQGAS